MHSFAQKYEAAQLFTTLIINRNIYWAANQYIKIISEGLCDSDDCSNDEIQLLITGIKYIHKENSLLQLNCNNISHDCFYCIFLK